MRRLVIMGLILLGVLLFAVCGYFLNKFPPIPG